MSSEIDFKNIDPNRIKILKSKNNPNYMNDYYKTNKLRCEICDVNISLNSKATHVASSKHQLKMLKSGKTETDNCFVKVKVEKPIKEE